MFDSLSDRFDGIFKRLRGKGPADAIAEGLAKGDTSAAQLGTWGADVQSRRRPHAAPGLRILRRLQLRHSSSKNSRTCADTVTDLLIGDLFTDRVDEVWGPMESLYPAGKIDDPRLDGRTRRAVPATRSTSCSSPPARSGWGSELADAKRREP